MTEQPKPHVYVPEDPDALRDGLFKGFWAHRNQTQKTPAVGAGASASESKEPPT